MNKQKAGSTAGYPAVLPAFVEKRKDDIIYSGSAGLQMEAVRSKISSPCSLSQ